MLKYEQLSPELKARARESAITYEYTCLKRDIADYYLTIPIRIHKYINNLRHIQRLNGRFTYIKRLRRDLTHCERWIIENRLYFLPDGSYIPFTC